VVLRPDGMLSLNGSDFVTIDGINFNEVAGNTTPTTQMEYAIGLFKASGINGSNNNTIKNCVITLNRNNSTTAGTFFFHGASGIVLAACAPTAVTTAIVVTNVTGASSNNTFHSNTIQNVNTGISMVGFADVSPFALADVNNDIGGTSLATGNTILNFGGGTTPANACAAVYHSNQWGANISYNTINNNDGGGANHATTNRGVFLFGTSPGASVNINNNNITIKGGTSTTAIDWAIDCEMASSGANGNTININNNTLSITKTTATTVALTAIWVQSAPTNCNINGNTVTNFTSASTSSSSTDHGVIRSGLAGISNLNVNNNNISGVLTTGITGTVFCISVTGSVTNTVNINGNNINGITNSTATTKSLNIINRTGAANTATASISNNNFQNISHTGSGLLTFMTATGTPLHQTINANTFTNLSIASTGGVNFIAHSYTVPAGGTQTISNNTIVTGFTKTGVGGTVNCMTSGASTIAAASVSHINNNFSNITVSGATILNGIASTDGLSTITYGRNVTGNTFNNWVGGTSAITVMSYAYWGGTTGSVANNTITNISGQGAITAINIGASGNAANPLSIYSNQINNISSTGTGGAVVGINCTNTSPTVNIYSNEVHTLNSTGAVATSGISIGGANNTSVYNNKIYNLSGSNAASSVNGILVSGGTTINIYNNLIGDLRATIANASNPINGLNFTGGTNNNASYNTVYLNATSSGALFGSSALSAASTINLTLRNNILVNTSTPNGALGFTCAYRRSTTTIGTHLAASNNNLLYAGIPGANNLIFSDGTNNDQSVANFKIRVLPADLNTGSENPNFLSTTGASANFLHVDGATASNIESGAANVSGITNDFDLETRQGNIGYSGTGTAPDIGADEINGTPALALAPPINFSSNSHTVNSFTITWDDNSVGESGFVVYRSLNIGGPFTTVVGVVPSTTSAGTGSTYTLPQSFLMGSTTYYYQVVANNFSNSSPLSGNASTLSCGSGLSGTFLIPTNYATLTAAITALVTNGMSGPVILSLEQTYDGTLEPDYPVVINNTIGCLNPTNTLTIRPDASVTVPLNFACNDVVAGIDLNGCNFVTIDGRPGGTGTLRMLNIINVSATGVAIRITNDASNNTITYCDVQGQNIVSSPTLGTHGGVIFINAANATSLNGNDNNTISYNNIHGTNTVPSTFPAIGIAAFGTNTTPGAYNDNCNIISNNIYDYFLAGSSSSGMKIDAGNTAWNISNNRFYQTTALTYTSAVTHRALWITPNVGSISNAANGFNVSGNYIGGNDASATSNYVMTSTVAASFIGMDLSVGLGLSTEVQGNTINKISFTTANASTTSFLGISVANGINNIGNIVGNVIGDPTANSVPYGITYTTTTNLGGLMGIRIGSGAAQNISNNIISGIDLNGNNTTVVPSFAGINYAAGASALIQNNTIGSATLANSILVSTSGATTTTNNATFRGIWVSGTAANSNVSGNVIANLTNNFGGTGTSGNLTNGITVNSGTSFVSNNEIRNITSFTQSGAGGANSGISGIVYTATTTPATISNNLVHSLKIMQPATAAGVTVVGLFYNGPTTGTNVIERNNMHSLSLASPNAITGAISGMDIAGGLITIKNNMIRLGYDDAGVSIPTACLVRGITKNAASSNIYHNSIFIGGSGVGSSSNNTFALVKTANGTDDWRNNICVNNRANASTGAKHYAISLNSTTTLTLNYNVYQADSMGGVFGFNGASDVLAYSLNWVAGDSNSYYSEPNYINPTGSASTGDLHINTGSATIVEATGINIPSVTNDIDNQTRSGLTPTDIGADAGTFISLVCNGKPDGGNAMLASSGNICVSGTKVLNLVNASSLPGISVQWMESATAGGPYANVVGGSGANTNAYTTANLTSTNYYICVVTCSNGGDTAASTEIAVVVDNPQVLTTTPDTRCGTGSVTLCATGSAGTSLSWYANPTGGVPLSNPYSNVAITSGSFNNDVVADGEGVNTIVGTTYPAIGMDGAQYTFIDNTFKYNSGSALPSCFMPTSNLMASALTSGLVYQLQSYTSNNAMSIANNSTGYTSPLANSGTLTLTTPASYGKLKVLYESVANTPTTGFAVDAIITFTDATTESITGNNVVNWFTAALPAFTGVGRTTPTGAIQCGAQPNLFEMTLPISVANQSKLVQSITFTIPALLSGTTPSSINYFHAFAVGGNAPQGNCITTPEISTTTTFYVAASTGGPSVNLGLPAATGTPSTGSGTTNFGLVFDAISSFTLNSVKIYPVSATNASGTVTIDVINSTGAVVHTATVPVTGSPAASLIPTTVTLNFNIAPGTNYKLRPGSITGITGLLFMPAGGPTNYGYPFVYPGVVSINTSTLTAAPTNTARNDLYYYFFDWSIGTGCESARTPVVATVTPPPALSVTPNITACYNTYSSLVVTSPNGNYDSYTWSPVTNLYLDTLGTPYTPGFNTDTVYVLSTTSATISYICTGTNSLPPFCSDTTTSTVVFQQNAIVSTSATPNPSCAGDAVILNASLGAPTTVVLGINNNATKIGGANGNLYRTGTTTNLEMRTQYLITAAELTAAGLQAGPMNSIGFYVLTSTTPGILSNFTLRLGHTTASALTATYQTGPFTDVWFASTFTPVIGLNTHTFSTPFVWNGVDNLVIESCNTLTTGGSGTTLQTFTTPVQTNMANLVAGGCSALAGGSSGFTNCRPVIEINGSTAPMASGYSWSDGTNVVGTSSSITVNPTTNTGYICTVTANGCPFVSDTIHQVVNPLPTVPTASAPSVQCGYGVPTASVTSTTGAPTPVFNWYSAPSGGTLMQSGTSNTYLNPISATTTFYVVELSIDGCESNPRVAVVANVSAYDSIYITSDTLACDGSPISFTVTKVGSLNTYNYTWTATPLAGSGIVGSPTGASQAFTATLPGTYVYMVTGVDGLCTANAQKTVSIYPSITGTVSATQISSCSNLNGSINANVSGAGIVFNNDFSSPVILGNMTYAGNDFAIVGGQMQLTSSATNKTGGVEITNTTGLANNDFQIDFDLITTPGSNPVADGFSYSYGPDVVALPTGNGSSVVGTVVAPNTVKPENGSGTALKLAFDAYTNGANVEGVYLMYNTPVWNQTPASTGVIVHSSDVSWRATNVLGKTTHVTIKINSLGQVSLWLNNILVVNNQPLPATYLSANKATWKHAFSSSTGGLYQGTYIDNLNIQYNNFYEYSVNAGPWSTANPIPASGVGTYSVDARYVAIPSCVTNLGSVTIAAPVFNTLASSTSVCAYGPVMPLLSVLPTFAGATYQWQISPAGANTFVDISGATSATYTPLVSEITADTDFRCVILCSGTPIPGSPSIPVTITYDQPQVLSTNGGSRCGIGSVALNATASTGALLNWYAAPTGGVSLGTGTTFNTPNIGATTTYYVAAGAGSSSENVASPNIGTSTFITATLGWGLRFTANSSATISSVTVRASSSTPGPATIQIRVTDLNDVILYTGTLHNFSITSTLTDYVVPVNITVPSGNYKMGMTFSNITAMVRESSGVTFPYNAPSSAIAITAGANGSGSAQTTSAYYWFYNWVISTGCSSTRTAVTATVTPAPLVTVSPNVIQCEGSSTTLTASSSNDPDYSYTWNPGGFVGATYLVTPTSTTTYTVTAVDSSGNANNGCQDIQTVTVTVTPNPVINNITATPPFVGQGDSSQLAVTATPFILPTFAAQYSLTSLSGLGYAPLSGGGITVVNTNAQLTAGMGSVTQDDGGILVNIPFTFNYNGTGYNQMSMSTNGWVAAGDFSTITAINSRTAGNFFTATAPNRTLAAWFKDMGGNFPLGTGSLRHGLTGTDIYTFQWDNAVGSGFSDGSTNLISFQISIYGPASAAPGRIEYVYGPQVNTLATAASIGLENNIGGTGNYLNALTGTSNSTTTSTVWPGAGNGYRFDPLPANLLTYNWAPATSLNSATISNPMAAPLASTVYTVIVAESGTGCTVTGTVSLEVAPKPKPFLNVGDTSLCSNVFEFYIRAADSGAYVGGWPLGTLFDWGVNGPGFPTTDSFIVVNASSAVNVIVTLPASLGSLTATTLTSIIDFGSVITPVTYFVTDSVDCNGQSNGMIIGYIDSIFSGVPNYRWRWYASPSNTLIRDVTNAEMSDTISGLLPGNYYLILTDHQGIAVPPYCTPDIVAVTVYEPAVLVASENLSNHVNVSCNGLSDGAVDLEVNGGTAPFSFVWSNGATTEDINGLAANTYTVTVTDYHGCTTSFAVTITEPTDLVVNCTLINNVSCNGGNDGAVNVASSGGVAPYTVSPSPTGLSAGVHTFVVTDANGCMDSCTATITEPLLLEVACSATNVVCYQADNGTANVTPTGGTLPYNYSWSNGATTNNISSLQPGTYTVIVTDANGCTASCNVTITQPDELIYKITNSVDPTSMLPNSGSITTSTVGGTLPYSYLWNDGVTTADRTGIPGGTYTATVTDANGCTSVISITLSYICNLTVVNQLVQQASCYQDNGIMTVIPSGGTSYTYQWLTTPVQTTATGTGLAYAFNSYCIITDVASGCSIIDTVVVPHSKGLKANFTVPTYAGGVHIRCYGESNGSASVSVTGADGPFTFLWSNGATTSSVTGLAAGTYTLTISNGGCTLISMVTLKQPALLTATASATAAGCGASNGTVTVNATGGKGAYTYTWNTIPVSTTKTVTGLPAGVYTVTVGDANGCTATASATVTGLSGLTVTAATTNVSCFGGTNGSAIPTVTGGTAPYTYAWSHGPTNKNQMALAAGTYTVTATANNGCTGSVSITISQPTAMAAIASSTPASCNGGNNGTVSVSASGGTPPYTYSWNTAPIRTTATATGLKKGTYTCTITDSKGCIKFATAIITEPVAIVISISKTNVTTFGGNNGTATANVTGGVNPYTFIWSNGQTMQTATGLIAGTYTVTVTDFNGCTKTKSVNITQPVARMAFNTATDIHSVVYPNPSKGKVVVSFDETVMETVTVEIINVTGERVYKSHLNVDDHNRSFEMDLYNLAKGVYTVSYQVLGKQWHEKLIIQ
jgi:hypothetical protein